MSNNADWSEGFVERMYAKLKAMGYETVTQFLECDCGRGYKAAARIFGGNVAPLQLTQLQFDEAEQCGTIRAACKDSLVRHAVEYIPQGLGGCSDYFQRALFGSAWETAVHFRAPQRKHLAERARKVWDELVKLAPPPTWVPKSVDDEFVVRAFERGWPDEDGRGKAAGREGK